MCIQRQPASHQQQQTHHHKHKYRYKYHTDTNTDTNIKRTTIQRQPGSQQQQQTHHHNISKTFSLSIIRIGSSSKSSIIGISKPSEMAVAQQISQWLVVHFFGTLFLGHWVCLGFWPLETARTPLSSLAFSNIANNICIQTGKGKHNWALTTEEIHTYIVCIVYIVYICSVVKYWLMKRCTIYIPENLKGPDVGQIQGDQKRQSHVISFWQI